MMLKHRSVRTVHDGFGSGIVIPLVKDKRGDVHDSDKLLS